MKKDEEKTVKKIEGYIDEERRVFVCTGDPHNLLGDYEVVGSKKGEKDVREIISKYKPQ